MQALRGAGAAAVVAPRPSVVRGLLQSRADAEQSALFTGLGVGGGPASAAGGSFSGCPLLLENQSSGPCVEKLQNELNAVDPQYKLTVTGTFDAPTRIAVLDFQGRNHLGADGNVGSVTANELERQYGTLSNGAGPKPAGPATGSPSPSPSASTSNSADCPGRGQSFVSGGSAVVELAKGENHPNVGDGTDTIKVTHSQGSSGTWTSSDSVSGSLQIGGDPAKFGLTAATESSKSMTLTLTRAEEHDFTVPAHSTMRVDYMAVLGVTEQGNKCEVNRTEVKVLGTGYRITTVDEKTGAEKQTYNWPTMTNVAVGTF